jgi:Protein of unknown function (DUF4229)
VPLLRYSLLRIVVLLASFGLFWLIGMRGWPWLIVSVIVAGAVSFLTMRTQRDAAVGSLTSRAEAVDKPVRGGDEDAEDRALDEAERTGQVEPVEPVASPQPVDPPSAEQARDDGATPPRV